jgi:hypothetical protein
VTTSAFAPVTEVEVKASTIRKVIILRLTPVSLIIVICGELYESRLFDLVKKSTYLSVLRNTFDSTTPGRTN